MMIAPHTHNRPPHSPHLPIVYGTPESLSRTPNLIVEIGPGRGDFLFHLALQHPTSSIVGIELKRKRFEKLICRSLERKTHQVTLIEADAGVALHYFQSQQIQPKKSSFPLLLVKEVFSFLEHDTPKLSFTSSPTG